MSALRGKEVMSSFKSIRLHKICLQRLLWVSIATCLITFSTPLPIQATQKSDNPLKELKSWQRKGLEEALKDPYDAVKILALIELQTFKENGAPLASLISGFLKSPNPGLKITIIDTLVILGDPDPKYISEVAELLKDSDWRTRSSAVEALVYWGEASKEYISDVAQHLK